MYAFDLEDRLPLVRSRDEVPGTSLQHQPQRIHRAYFARCPALVIDFKMPAIPNGFSEQALTSWCDVTLIPAGGIEVEALTVSHCALAASLRKRREKLESRGLGG